MILDRFDAIVFIGDESLRQIYAAFNILLRENLASGGLRQWDMTPPELKKCRGDGQFNWPDCVQYAITSSQEIQNNGTNMNGAPKSPYHCNRTSFRIHYYSKSDNPNSHPSQLTYRKPNPGVPHFILSIPNKNDNVPNANNDPTSEAKIAKLSTLLTSNPDSYKPVPIIQSLSPNLALSLSDSLQVATNSMDEWVSLADSTGKNAPWLWVGPKASPSPDIQLSSSKQLMAGPGSAIEAQNISPPPPSDLLSVGSEKKEEEEEGEGEQATNDNNINAMLRLYTTEVIKEAKDRGLDGLGMWNFTKQVTTGLERDFHEAQEMDGRSGGRGGVEDGKGCPQTKIRLVQAMMVSWNCVLFPSNRIRRLLITCKCGVDYELAFKT